MLMFNKRRPVDRQHTGPETFDIFVDGRLTFRAERAPPHGYWVLRSLSGQRLDEDKYSNDLLERVAFGHYLHAEPR